MRRESDEQENKRRIKTETNSTNSSGRVITHHYDNILYEYKLPPIKTEERLHERHSLNVINQQRHSFPISKGYATYDRRPSESLPHPLPLRKKMEICKVSKIFEEICRKKDIESESRQIRLTPSKIELQTDNQKYIAIEQAFKELKSRKKTRNTQQLLNFINNLKQNNSLFHKLDDIFSLILFKKGKVLTFQKNRYIYQRDEAMNQLFVLLWGQIRLKDVYTNKVRYCIPGDFLSEEVIVGETKTKLFGDQIFFKGNYITNQEAKAKCSCGVLGISKEAYEQIKRKYLQKGEKQQVLTFQRLIVWSLSKKAKFRK